MSVQQRSPADAVSTKVDGVDVLGALSPSRAGDFVTCPLLYRFRSIDKLPEAPSPDAARGSVVHKVLEQLFDLPAAERTPSRAQALVEPAWELLRESAPELTELFSEDEDGSEVVRWMTSVRTVLDRYFTLEDPRRLEPAERELYVEAVLDSRLLLRGFIDRVDVAPDGRVRVVDYKGLATSTPLPTPDGWTTMADVSVGDELLGSDGRPTRVTIKSGVHHRPCYRVTFADGSTVDADNVHLWTVTHSRRQVETTETIDTDGLHALHHELAAAGRRKSLWIRSADPVCIDDDVRLPIDPWILGAWLGDGDSRSGQFTVGAQDLDDMLTAFKQRWPGKVSHHKEGTAFRVSLSRLDDVCTYGHPMDRPPTPGYPHRRCSLGRAHPSSAQTNLGLTALLRASGLLHNKSIPAPYLRASTKQRLDLLRGLMDTDGWWNATRHRAGYTTTDNRLAADVIELLRTLGVHPQHFAKPYANAIRPGRNWHVIEFTPLGFNPFALPRKAIPCAAGVTPLQAKLARRRVITAIQPIDPVPTQCVAVDAADSLYLCGDGFVPTHNTGRAPGPGFEAKALFQLRFYALVLWRTRGVVPAMLQLIYLGSGDVLRYVPDEDDLRATERKVEAIWRAIRTAEETGDWRPSPSKLCAWCSHKALCPAYGGTPPPLPTSASDPGGLSDEDLD